MAEKGSERHGRRVPVTEMIPLGLKGDRQMLIGGLAGWAMALFLAGAAWLACKPLPSAWARPAAQPVTTGCGPVKRT